MSGKRQDIFYQAQAILARRDHSRAEVVMKLKKKGFMTEEIAKTVDALQEKNLINDARFAGAYIEGTLRAKPVGPRYLFAKLKQKGVREDVIQKTLAEAFQNPPQPSFIKEGANSPLDKGESEGISASREVQLAQQAAEQWKRLHPKHAEDKQRLYRFLASRGFTSDAIAGSAPPPAGE